MIVRSFLICFYLNIFFVSIIFKYISFAWPETIRDATEKLKFIFIFNCYSFLFSKLYVLYYVRLWWRQFRIFFVNSVFHFLNVVFQSYEFFETRKQYCSIPASLHLCFRSILKFSKIFDFGHFSWFSGSQLCAFWIFRFF